MSATVRDRAAAYVAKIPGAVEGSGGEAATRTVIWALAHGFALSEEEAWPILCTWNQGCDPPWPEHALRRKLQAATRKAPGCSGYGEKAGRSSPAASAPVAAKADFPVLGIPSRKEIAAIANSRRIEFNTCALVAEHGMLRVADWRGHRAWTVCDQKPRAAGLRRIDGAKWEQIRNKAWTAVRGQGDATRLVGGGMLASSEVGVVTEGGPDYLATAELIIAGGWGFEACPVLMWAAGYILRGEDADRFKGKYVVIATDPDKSGDEAALHLAASLRLRAVRAVRWSCGDHDVNDALIHDKAGAVRALGQAIEAARKA